MVINSKFTRRYVISEACLEDTIDKTVNGNKDGKLNHWKIANLWADQLKAFRNSKWLQSGSVFWST